MWLKRRLLESREFLGRVEVAEDVASDDRGDVGGDGCERARAEELAGAFIAGESFEQRERLAGEETGVALTRATA